MKRLFTTTLSILFACSAFCQGLIMNQEDFDAMEKFDPSEEMGFASGTMPSSVSYRKYAPFPGYQGDVSTCVGWAMAYGQLTTQQNLYMDITNMIQRSARAMDPNFLYSIIRNKSDKWCEEGTSMAQALEVLENIGCKPLVSSPWFQCNTAINRDDISLALARPYMIKESKPIEPNVDNVKYLLSQGLIVSGGFLTDNQFMSDNTVKTGKWSFSGPLDPDGAHAMCIVGYDDYKYGGAFEILNSYSAQFGDEGFVWISYNDFKKTAFQTWIMNTPGYRSNSSCLFGDCSSSYSIFKTNNGDYYEGLVENDYPNIYGSKYHKNGSFYVGGWKNGYEHGQGLVYSVSTNKYYNVTFSMGKMISSNEGQGFASADDMKNMETLYGQLNSKAPGELVDPDSEDYEEFVNNFEMSEEPLSPPTLDAPEPIEKPEAPETQDAEPSSEKETKKMARKRKRAEKKLRKNSNK